MSASHFSKDYSTQAGTLLECWLVLTVISGKVPPYFCVKLEVCPRLYLLSVEAPLTLIIIASRAPITLVVSWRRAPLYTSGQERRRSLNNLRTKPLFQICCLQIRISLFVFLLENSLEPPKMIYIYFFSSRE